MNRFSQLLIISLIVTSVTVSSFSSAPRGPRPVHYRTSSVRRQTADYNEGGTPSNMPSPPEHGKGKGKVTKKKPLSSTTPLPLRRPSPPPPTVTVTNNAPMVTTANLHQDSEFEPFFDDPNYRDQENDASLYDYEMNHGQDQGGPFDQMFQNEQKQPNFQVRPSNGQVQMRPTTMTTTTVTPETEKPGANEEEEEEGPPAEPAPFGFEETILIIVPQVKYKIHGLPKWFGASFRLSYPITIFFDELDWPKGFNKWGFPRFPMYPYQALLQVPPRQRRRTRSILELPPATSFPGMERATLIPKLEKTLMSSGLGGRACLLRCVCEIHDADVRRNYGFLGEILHKLFSISNSVYAETHLPGYLEAEMLGKNGDCSRYLEKCSRSLFAVKTDHCELGVKDC